MASKHAEGEQEHALCGLAFDAFESGDESEPVIFAKKNEQVTCKNCIAHIDFVKKAYSKSYIYKI